MKIHSTSSASADDPVLRRKEAAEYLGIAIPSFDRLVRSGNGPKVVKLSPRAVGSRRSWLNEYLDRLAADGNNVPPGTLRTRNAR